MGRGGEDGRGGGRWEVGGRGGCADWLFLKFL